MKKIKCAKCNKTLKIGEKYLFCPKCGEAYMLKAEEQMQGSNYRTANQNSMGQSSNYQQNSQDAMNQTSNYQQSGQYGGGQGLNNKGKKSNKKTIFLCVGLAIALIIVGVLVYMVVANHFGQTQESEAEGFNMLVVGRDNTGEADMVMLLKITEDEVKGTSIPRDTLLSNKKLIDVLSEKNGIDKAKELVEDALSTEIEYCTEVDMDIVEGLVDAVGGVNFNVPQNMRYQDPMQNLNINLSKGYQHLDGEEAGQLVRFRSYAGGKEDLERINMQQDFMKALVEQILDNITLEEMVSIGKIFHKETTTDYSVTNLKDDLTLIYAVGSKNFSFTTVDGYADYYKGEPVYRLSK